MFNELNSPRHGQMKRLRAAVSCKRVGQLRMCLTFLRIASSAKQRGFWCNFNSSNIPIVKKCKAIEFVERIPYQRLFSFGYILWRITYLLYGSVASLPSPSSNIEAWPYGKSLRFVSLLNLGHLGYVNISDYAIVILYARI